MTSLYCLCVCNCVHPCPFSNHLADFQEPLHDRCADRRHRNATVFYLPAISINNMADLRNCEGGDILAPHTLAV